MSPQAGVKIALKTERRNCDYSLCGKTWQFFQDKRAHLYSGKPWFLSSVRVGSTPTSPLRLAGRQAESALCCRAQTRTAHSVQHGASNLELLRLTPLPRLIIGCLSMHCYHQWDSSLPLQLLRLSERKKKQNRAFIEILNYCFLTPSPQSKAVTLLPTVARLMMDVSELCLPAGISILSAELASRLNKECEEAAAEALPWGLKPFRTLVVFNRHI